jgi:hypothetical protein
LDPARSLGVCRGTKESPSSSLVVSVCAVVIALLDVVLVSVKFGKATVCEPAGRLEVDARNFLLISVIPDTSVVVWFVSVVPVLVRFVRRCEVPAKLLCTLCARKA